MEILENKTISLRAPEAEDLEVLYRWENDTSLWHLSHTVAPLSRYVLKQYLEVAVKDIYETRQLRLMIQLRDTGRLVGAIDLFEFDPYNRRAGVGILIADRADRGQGYAREALETLKQYAFSVLQLHQLWCNIGPANAESLKLFEASGFRKAGLKKDWLLRDGTFEDEWLLQCIQP